MNDIKVSKDLPQEASADIRRYEQYAINHLANELKQRTYDISVRVPDYHETSVQYPGNMDMYTHNDGMISRVLYDTMGTFHRYIIVHKMSQMCEYSPVRHFSTFAGKHQINLNDYIVPKTVELLSNEKHLAYVTKEITAHAIKCNMNLQVESEGPNHVFILIRECGGCPRDEEPKFDLR